MKSTLAVFCALALATCAAAATAFADYGPCHPTGSSASKVTRFQETFVCITFNGVQRAIFNPKADDYSLLNIAGCTCLHALTLAAALHLGVHFTPHWLSVRPLHSGKSPAHWQRCRRQGYGLH